MPFTMECTSTPFGLAQLVGGFDLVHPELREHGLNLRHPPLITFEECHGCYSFLGLTVRLASANRP